MRRVQCACESCITSAAGRQLQRLVVGHGAVPRRWFGAAASSLRLAPPAAAEVEAAPLIPPRRSFVFSSGSPPKGAAGPKVSDGGAVEDEKPKTRRIYDTLFSNWQKGLVTSIGACMGVGAVALALWTPFKHDASVHTAAVASDVLGDVKLKEQATALSKQVVEDVLKDQQSVELLVSVIKRLLAEKESRVAVTLFIQSVFEDPHTQEISKKFVVDLVQDPWVKERIEAITQSLVIDLLEEPRTKDIMTTFLLATALETLKDHKLHAETGKAVRASAYFAINPWAAPPPPVKDEDKIGDAIPVKK